LYWTKFRKIQNIKYKINLSTVEKGWLPARCRDRRVRTAAARP
jgi:hypothetical protein